MTALRNVAAIVGKEWRHYFGSPIAWVALFVWTLLFGIFFYFAFTFFLEQSMRMAQQGMEFGGGVRVSINEYLIRPIFHNMAVVALFVAPMLTMRLFAEEKRQGTIELLATSPMSDLQVVLGKFLAAALLYALMILAGLVNVALIWTYATSRPEWKPVLTGALGLFLLGCCFLAMGTFVSTLTRNQIVAGILSFCLFLGHVDARLGGRPDGRAGLEGRRLPRGHDPPRGPREGSRGPQGRRLLPQRDHLRALPGARVGREPALEGVRKWAS